MFLVSTRRCRIACIYLYTPKPIAIDLGYLGDLTSRIFLGKGLWTLRRDLPAKMSWGSTWSSLQKRTTGLQGCEACECSILQNCRTFLSPSAGVLAFGRGSRKPSLPSESAVITAEELSDVKSRKTNYLPCIGFVWRCEAELNTWLHPSRSVRVVILCQTLFWFGGISSIE